MKKLILLLTILALATVTQAAPTFYDNFDNENGGVGKLNYTDFSNGWTVTNGTVDLIGNGYFDYQPGHGLYIDMDGSTDNAGIITNNISLAAGTYNLTFKLAGNHRNDNPESVSVKVGLGSIFSEDFSLARNAPFTLFERKITVINDAVVPLSFAGGGGDNAGMLLDDVCITAVPAPGAFLLGGIGIACVGWIKRRKIFKL